jgi:hypothetical protein
VWQQCDGATAVTEIADRAAVECETAMDEELVWVALEDLWKRELLEGEAAPAREGTMSRSQVLKRAGLVAAVSVPVVVSIAAPKAAHAATCINSGVQCNPGQTCCGPPMSACPQSGTCP